MPNGKFDLDSDREVPTSSNVDNDKTSLQQLFATTNSTILVFFSRRAMKKVAQNLRKA